MRVSSVFQARTPCHLAFTPSNRRTARCPVTPCHRLRTGSETLPSRIAGLGPTPAQASTIISNPP